MSEFWQIIEDDLNYPIPNFIKNGFTMTGYAHPMVFKAVTDIEIAKVETFIRERSLGILEQSAHDSINEENCEVVIDEEQLRDYFGDLYANDTLSFRFEAGDIMLIKELVEHVKSIADANGKNTGLGHFAKTISRKRRKAVVQPFSRMKKEPKFNEETLAIELRQKVMACFNSHMVDMNTDAINIEQIVEMRQENGKYIGLISCVICKIENKKKQSPKRVNYKLGKKGCWILSNLVKHLEDVHHLKAQVNKIEGSPAAQDTEQCQSTETNNSLDENDNSCIILEDGLKRDANIKRDDPEQLFTQLTSQITKVMAAVLTNQRKSNCVEISFALDKSPRKLSIALIEGDGSCMFAALAHQLFLHPINSPQHNSATKKLRIDVVEHILKTENFPLFEYHLKDRVYEIKRKNEITNMTMECKLFVRHVLSSPRTYGGVETLNAVSDLYSTNIVVFSEDGVCTKYNKADQTYDRTIAVAHCYRLNENGEKIRNHYDSIFDASGADLFAAARYIAK